MNILEFRDINGPFPIPIIGIGIGYTDLAAYWPNPTSTFQGCFNCETEKPMQGDKMTMMDILEFRDINGPPPKGPPKKKLFRV